MRQFIAFLVFSVFTISAFAQNAKRAIILVNGTAVVADLASNGSVVQRYQSIPSYFNNNLSDQQIIAQAEASGLRPEGELQLYAESIDEEVIPQLSTFRKTEDFTADGECQYIAFSRGRALLNQQAVDQVRSIADAYLSGRIAKINISSYHRDSNASRTLAQNRANALVDLLTTFGMSLDAIEVRTPYGIEADHLYHVYLSFGE